MKAQDTAQIVYVPAAKSKLPTRTHVCAVLSASLGLPGPSRSTPRREPCVKYAQTPVDRISCSGTTVTSAVHAIVVPVDCPSIKVLRASAPIVIRFARRGRVSKSNLTFDLVAGVSTLALGLSKYT